MKKILLIFALLPLWVFPQQVADIAMETYANTYINTNNVGSITGAQMNQMLNYLISSKVNHDSATTVRVSTGLDTLFVTYWGYPEDTVLVSGGTSLWSRSGDYLYPASITDSIGINTSTPEFQLDVNGTMGIRDVPTSTSDTFLVLTNDSVAKRVITNRDWTSFTPTLSWTGGTPAAPTTVARYQVRDHCVDFYIMLRGTNNSGFTLTALNITLPVTPKDVDALVSVDGAAAPDGTTPTVRYPSYIDAENNTAGNRKLYASGMAFAIKNGSSYIFIFRGFYEID